MAEFQMTTTQNFINYINSLPYGDTDWFIASALLANTGRIQMLTLEELAEDAGASPASVSRFFRKAGFRDFRTFKAHYAEEIPAARAYIRSYHYPADTDPVTRAEQDYQKGLANLKATHDRLDMDLLQEIVGDMLKAREIIMVGDLHELQIFHTVQLNLLYHRKPASLLRIREAEPGILNNAGPDSFLLFLSAHYFWHKERMENLLNKAVQQKCTSVLLSQDEPPRPDMYSRILYYGIPGARTDGYLSLEYLTGIFGMLVNTGDPNF